MKSKVNYKKLGQIVFVYALALVAVTACAGYKQKTGFNASAITGGAVLVAANRADFGSGSTLVIQYQVSQDGNVIALTTGRAENSGGAGEQTASSGNYNYDLKDFCTDASCGTIAVTINWQSPNTGSSGQNAYLLVYDGVSNTMTVRKNNGNTTYASAEAASESLLNQL